MQTTSSSITSCSFEIGDAVYWRLCNTYTGVVVGITWEVGIGYQLRVGWDHNGIATTYPESKYALRHPTSVLRGGLPALLLGWPSESAY